MSVTRVLLAVALESERERIATRRARFDEALALAGPELDAWLVERWVQRGLRSGGRVSWLQLLLADPALAGAASRWLREHGHPLPSEVAHTPQAQLPLTDQDWALLVADYARHAPPSPARGAVVDAQAELAGTAATVLRGSAVKPGLACDALAAEDEGRGGALRAVVLADGVAQAQAVREAIAADERLVDLGDRATVQSDGDGDGDGGCGDANVVVDLRGEARADTVWVIVCVDPGLPGGGPDYAALVARAADPAAIDPALTAAGAPPAERFAEINLRQRDAATGGAMGAPALLAPATAAAPVRHKATLWQRFVAAVRRAGRRRPAHPDQAELPADWAAHAVCDAYVALGELRRHFGMRFTPGSDGRLRHELQGVDDAERARVQSALAPLLGPGAVPTWVVSRQVVLPGARSSARAWYPVPDDFARAPERRAAFVESWRRWMGPGWLLEIGEAELEDPELAALAVLAQRPGGVDDGRADLGDRPDDGSDLPTLPERARL